MVFLGVGASPGLVLELHVKLHALREGPSTRPSKCTPKPIPPHVIKFSSHRRHSYMTVKNHLKPSVSPLCSILKHSTSHNLTFSILQCFILSPAYVYQKDERELPGNIF